MREKKTLRSKEQRGAELPGFSFCFMQLRHGAEEACNLEMPNSCRQNKNKNKIILNKSLLFLAKGQEMGVLAKQFLGRTPSTPRKHQRKKLGQPLPYQQTPSGELRLVPLGGCNEAPNLSVGTVQQFQWRPCGESDFHSHPAVMRPLSISLLGCYIKRPRVESGISPSDCLVVTKTPPAQWWWRLHGESELPFLTPSNKRLIALGFSGN